MKIEMEEKRLREEGRVEDPGHRIVFEIGQDERYVGADFYREI